jgi:protein-disulfide isomerase
MEENISDNGSATISAPRRFWRVLVIGVGVFVGVIGVLAALIGVVLFRRQATQVADAPTPAQFSAARDASSVPVTPEAFARLIASDDPSVGPADARVTIVEFGDFQCPVCLQAFPIIRELMAIYGDRVRFVYRDFPVFEIHPEAQKAAEAAQCAHAEGKFWAMHDKMFQNAGRLTVDALRGYARAVGLDAARFDACLASGKFARAVAGDAADGRALGVRGTPTWFINGRKVEGVIPRDALVRVIEQLLAL